jgi:hypothetical protein
MRTVDEFYKKFINCTIHEGRRDIRIIAKFELRQDDYIIFLEECIESLLNPPKSPKWESMR